MGFLHPSALLPGSARAATSNTSIWITGPLVKVLQTNTTAGTTQSLQISAARNEFADFQVHALPTAGSIQMNLTVSDFTNAQAHSVISSASNVLVYREAYLNITTASDQNGTLGVTPDPLIPAVDPYFGQARNAFPFTVAASQTQSAWIDVLVPSAAPPGYYYGTVTISDGSTVIGQLTVALRVWAFALPSTATLKSAFGVSSDPNGMCIQAFGAGSDSGYNECAAYPGSGGSPDKAIELILRSEAMLALDHRLSLSAVYVGPPAYDWAHFDSTYGDLLNGTAPTVLSGAAFTTFQYTPPAADETMASVIQDWVSHFSANGWLGALFDYTCDEPPNGCTWAGALSKEQAIHAGSTSMKTLITTNIANANTNGVANDLNIIVPIVNDMEPQGGSNQRAAYNAFLSGTNTHLWWYQSCESHDSCSNGTVGAAAATWPSYMIDASPVRGRVFQWLAFIDSIEAELYYQTDFCWLTSSTCGSSDPWIGVYAFGGNGDGTLFYPGTPAKIGGTTPVPVPSIRLKLLRDGMQDYEYLNALSKAGYDALARATAANFITNAYTFNNDPQALTAARETLGNRLNILTLPTCAKAGSCPHDFNADGNSDILWRDTSGDVAVWLMNSATIQQGASLGNLPTSWSIVGSRDFNGDGTADVLWRNSNGDLMIRLISNAAVAQQSVLGNVPTVWSVAGTGDFNGDGKGDILWRDTSGDLSIWFMNGFAAQATSLGTVPTVWSVAGVGDFNGDGYSDILWHDIYGDVSIWEMKNGSIQAGAGLGNVATNWSIVGTGDFNGDGTSDVLWRDTAGDVMIWLISNGAVQQQSVLGNVPTSWSIAGTGDFNSDGKSDIIWIDTSGNVMIWFMNGLAVSVASVGNVGTAWAIQGANAD